MKLAIKKERAIGLGNPKISVSSVSRRGPTAAAIFCANGTRWLMNDVEFDFRNTLSDDS